MTEILRKQYQSVASSPKEEFVINDPDYFFFFTSPDPASLSRFPREKKQEQKKEQELEKECIEYAEQRVHQCLEDHEGQEHLQEEDSRTSGEEWRLLLDEAIQRIEETERSDRARARFQVPGSRMYTRAKLNIFLGTE